MNIQQINIGQYPNDGTGDDLRTAFEKIVSNFSEIDSNVVLAAENLGIGIPLVLETAVNNKLQFRTIKSGNSNLAISVDSNELTLAVSDFALQDLTNVSQTFPEDKQVLGWNGVEWEPTVLNTSFLSNISTTDPTINQVLGWNGTIWEPASLNLNYLTDILVVNPSAGDSLIWDGTKWVSEKLQSGVSRIIAGNNITISPSSGVGDITINSTSTSTGSGIPDGFDFGSLGNPTNVLELLLQATPVEFGTITQPSSLILELGTLSPAPPTSGVVDGGNPGTIQFSIIANGGVPNDAIFEEILDGGPIVFVEFTDVLVNGGTPFDIDFSTIIDGETPSSPRSVILDCGIVT